MNDATQITQDTTVTAQYNANTYTVKINPNGASGSTKTYTVTYGQKWSVPSCPFSRTGYTFSGYSGGYSAGQSITITGNVSINCNWSIRTYQVSISPNGASGSTKYYSVTHGSTWTVPSCPFTRSGYTFNGYSGGYSVGQRITVTGNITINCNWAVVAKSTIQYKHTNGGNTVLTSNKILSANESFVVNRYIVSYGSSDTTYVTYFFPIVNGIKYDHVTVVNRRGTNYTFGYGSGNKDGYGSYTTILEV